MKKLFATIVIIATLCLAGCATAGGNKIDWNNARQVKMGMTQQEVTGLMGKPYLVRANEDGTQKWVWVYVNGWTFASSSASLTFAKDGTVKNVFQVPDSF